MAECERCLFLSLRGWGGGVEREEPRRRGRRGLRVVGGGEKSYNSRGQNFDPIDVLQEAAQLKPKPSYMSDFVNYSEHRLLTPR